MINLNPKSRLFKARQLFFNIIIIYSIIVIELKLNQKIKN